MQRLKDTLLTQIDESVKLQNKKVLEIGCGDGGKTVQLARLCAKLTAIDPDGESIKIALEKNIADNLEYQIGEAQTLNFPDDLFDVIIFSLSLHHVPISMMQQAINEAVRVCKRTGKLIVVEPSFTGSFFDAEVQFDACDGDERKEKAAAHYELLRSDVLDEVTEFYSDVLFKFTDEADFISTMNPKQDVNEVASFLNLNKYELRAQRRVNIYTPIKD